MIILHTLGVTAHSIFIPKCVFVHFVFPIKNINEKLSDFLLLVHHIIEENRRKQKKTKEKI
jgi:hypothetical protein